MLVCMCWRCVGDVVMGRIRERARRWGRPGGMRWLTLVDVRCLIGRETARRAQVTGLWAVATVDW